MSEYREFTGKSVEEALKLAREAFGADLNDLDFEILTPGSRGVQPNNGNIPPHPTIRYCWAIEKIVAVIQ